MICAILGRWLGGSLTFAIGTAIGHHMTVEEAVWTAILPEHRKHQKFCKTQQDSDQEAYEPILCEKAQRVLERIFDKCKSHKSAVLQRQIHKVVFHEIITIAVSEI